MENNYDSRQDTLAHINRVQQLLDDQRWALYQRGSWHDLSKLAEPEKPIFDKMTPKLKGLTYGSPEYAESLKELGVALSHHYDENSHHPEHFPGITVNDGIYGMNLFDLLEMLADWKAAGERHADGSYLKSFIHNRKRYHIGNPLWRSLFLTAGELGWLMPEEVAELEKILADEREALLVEHERATS